MLTEISSPFSSKNAGFSLVEMAIAIVIIGLLLGGILVGQDMVRSSELKSVISDKEDYLIAMRLFEEKHGYLPGDFPAAITLWGAADPTPATCQITASTGIESCNGNGDGKIAGVAGTEYEAFRAWQHLANEGMVSGLFNGIAASGGVDHADIGVNVPEAALDGGGFSLRYVGTDTGAGDYFSGRYGHVLIFGAETTTDATLAPILTIDEASELDEKFDDGRPGLGNIRTYKAGSAPVATCVTTAVAATAEYDNTQTGRQCHLIFIGGQ